MFHFRKPFVKSAQEPRGTSKREHLVLQKADLCDTTRGQSRLLLPYCRHVGAEKGRWCGGENSGCFQYETCSEWLWGIFQIASANL